MKYLIHWQILSVNTVTPETGAFYYLKISDAKGIQVILMYHYIHRFVQHASADIFCKGISGIANVKHRAENLPQTRLSVFSASLEVCLIECLRF